ncbi:MFS transporter [Bombilactobacillus thymidiniphilus]|uniref:MFS transporter n=1 Tax=Bombilactobacillus thymidiniphilus TaxID=2923363 RepID=A0ABY4PER0_9LACO|nr:MFS transporter [Bombilactobacillus thymidiniphilus]UQS84288.1 MFS transporter [Bombilactobacillus thymidiniphilus]
MVKIKNNIRFAALLSSGIDSLGTGSFVSVSTIFFATYSHVSPSIIGLGLTLSAISGTIASLPVAYLADKYGKLKIFSLSYILRAIGMLGWLFVSGNNGYLVYMTLFGIIDRSAGSLTKSLIIAPLSHKEATVLLGDMALPSNVGYGIGAGISSLATVAHTGLQPIIIINSMSFIVVVFVYITALKGTNVSAAKIKTSSLTSLSVIKSSIFNRTRFNLMIENFLFSFHRTLLNVYIPLLIVIHFKAFTWLSPLVFVINTITIALLQGITNKWAYENYRYNKLWISSGLLLSISFILIALIPKFNLHLLLIIVFIAIVVAQILAELFSSAAISVYMTIYSRNKFLATDLSAINLGGQLQNILGPMIFSSSAVSSSGILAITMTFLTVGASVHVALDLRNNKRGDLNSESVKQ